MKWNVEAAAAVLLGTSPLTGWPRVDGIGRFDCGSGILKKRPKIKSATSAALRRRGHDQGQAHFEGTTAPGPGHKDEWQVFFHLKGSGQCENWQ